VFWLVPAAALARPDGLVGLLAAAPLPAAVGPLVVLGVFALVGVAAVGEFVERGEGTPLPYDPPRMLVRSGPYAYCRNPMQSAIVVIFAAMATMTGSMRLAGAAVVALAYGAGLAVWHETEELPGRFGWSWTQYRRTVPAWRLRRRPAASGPQATVWVGQSCAQCRPIARFLSSRQPVRLEVRAAEDHPGPGLLRMTYEAEGRTWEGVGALARALEHLHLGWALVGWALRLPGVVTIVQVVADAAGGGPRRLPAAPRPTG
jgi:protein-S-isoprenylcysteine O-methyltransferase Ste14